MELSIADLLPFLPGLEEVLSDDSVSEVMVNSPGVVYVERAGRMQRLAVPVLDEAACWRAAIQISRPLGKDPNTEPIIDARLEDGSRVAICSPPASPTAAITIRRFGGRTFSLAELVSMGAIPHLVVEEARSVLASGGNILIAGGTGSGKTTTLNALVTLLPEGGRVVSIEDTLELQLQRENIVRFEARGLSGAVTIRDLVAACAEAPAGSHCRRGGPGRGSRGPVAGAEHGARRVAGDGAREQRDGGAVAPGVVCDAGGGCAALVCGLPRRRGRDSGGGVPGADAGGDAPG